MTIPSPRQRLARFLEAARGLDAGIDPRRRKAIRRLVGLAEDALDDRLTSDDTLRRTFRVCNQGAAALRVGDYSWRPPAVEPAKRVEAPDAAKVGPEQQAEANDGVAEPAESSEPEKASSIDLDSMNVTQLRELAKQRGIKLGRAKRHAAVLRVVRRAIDDA